MQIIKKASSLVKAVSAEPPTLADCDPSQTLRNRIRDDLQVKGLVGAPCKVDMSKIIPVYNFPANPSPEQRSFNALHNIGGTAGVGDFILRMSNFSPLKLYGYLKSFFCSVRVDVAGRAALAAAGDVIVVQIAHIIAGVSYTVGEGRWIVTASVGNDLTCFFGTHIRSNEPATSAYPAANLEFLFPVHFKLGPTQDMTIAIGLGLGGLFPVGSGALWVGAYDTYV